MGESKSWTSFWDFENAVARQTRYVRNGETEGFLEMVRQTAGKHLEVLPPETSLWRAQLGCNWECRVEKGVLLCKMPRVFEANRMKPLPQSATEGRANPKGIPCLYLATDQATAVGEVRPWIGSYVSVGRFETLGQLKVVNCVTGGLSLVSLMREPPPEKREESLWTCVGEAFTWPVTPNDNVADYVPTQIIAELLKVNGFDGIKYRSSVGKGQNIVLFELDVAELMERHLVRVNNVEFAFAEA